MSIYDYLKEKSTSEIAEMGYRLPDVDLEKGDVWVPGAYEGIILRSTRSVKLHTIINFRTALAVKKQALKPSEKHMAKLTKKLMKYPAISLVDPVCSYCVAFKIIKNEEKKAALRELALDLAKNAVNREPVKMGIALLGMAGKEEDLPVLEVLGKHDEFTLYCAGSAARILEGKKKNDFLMKLGDNTQGWGKISVLYELDYKHEDARLWAVKRGCRNTVGFSYVANVCAIKGNMADVLAKLSAGEIEEKEAEEILHGVCDIFTGLLNPDENQDGIREYGEAKRAGEALRNICQNMSELAEKDERAQKIVESLKNSGIIV